MRYPLNDEPAGLFEPIEEPADTIEIRRGERAAFLVHIHTTHRRMSRERRTPHVNPPAPVREGASHTRRVVGYASEHRWIFRRQQVDRHASAGSPERLVRVEAMKINAIGASGTSRRTNDVRMCPSTSVQLLKR